MDIDLVLGDRAGAEKTMRDLYKQRPLDQIVRLDLARLISADPAKLQEAISILQQPEAPNAGQRIQLVQLANELRLQTAAELATLQITQLDDTTDPAARQVLISQANSEYEILYRTWGERLETLKLKGEIALAEGRNIDAVQALSRALTITKAADDDELQEFLGRAYEATHQDTKAQQSYTLVVSHHPEYYPALVRLTRMLILHHDVSHADDYLKTLELYFPDDVDVMTLRLALLDLDRDKNKDEIDRKFARLPETNDKQRMQKVQLAAGLGRADDMARLLNAVMANEPKNVNVAINLSKFYVQTGHIDMAKDVAANALKVNPDSPDLQILSAQLNGATQEQLLALERQIYSKIADPFTKALRLEGLDVQAGDLHDAELELKTALQLKPDDGRVWDALFSVYMNQGDVKSANDCIVHLETANQDQAHGLLYRFKMAMFQKDFDTAVKISTEIIQELPQLAGGWLSRGQAEQAMGDPEKAIVDYTQARERQSDNPLALAGLIESNYTLGHNTEALNYILDAIKSNPDDPTWVDMEIRHYLKFGPLDSAEPLLLQEMYARQNSITPDSISQLIAVELQLARQYQARGDTDKANTYFGKANNFIGQALTVWGGTEPRFYTLAGAAHLMAGDYQGGEDAIRKLSLEDKFKNRAEPYTILADYQLSAGKLADAEVSLRTARSQTEVSADQAQAIRQQLANVLAAEGKTDDALALLGDSSVPAIRNQRINMDISAGRAGDAEKEIKAALATPVADQKPDVAATDQADLLSQLAGIEIARGDTDKASEHIAAALAKIPTHAMSLYYRGMIKLHATPADVNGAIADLTASRQQLPANPRIHGVLADAFKANQDYESERRELEIGVGQAPADKQIRVQLIQAYIEARPQRLPEAVAQAEDIRKNPQFTHDLDFLEIESRVLTAMGQYPEALKANALALQVAPNDATLISEELNILLLSKDYPNLESAVDPLIKAVSKPTWWMYDFRAIARAHLDDMDGAKDDLKNDLKLAHDETDLNALQVAVPNMCQNVGSDNVMAYLATTPSDDLRWKLAAIMADLSSPDTKSRAAEAASHVETSPDFAKLTKDQQVFTYRLIESAYISAKPTMDQQAADIDRKILTILPTDVSTLNNLANRLVAIDPKGNLKDALDKSQQAVDILQKSGQVDPHVSDTLGWMQVLSGSNQAAVNTLRPLLDRSPDLSICVHLATAYINLSDQQGAQYVIGKGMDLLNALASANQPVDSDLRAQFDAVHKKADDLAKSKAQAGAQ
jgi:tetratricopeptide (TPR) repeat protein